MKSSLFARWVVVNSLIVAFFITGIVYDITTDFVTDEFYMTQGIAVIALLFMLRAGYVSWLIQKDIKNLVLFTRAYRSASLTGRGDDHKDFLTDIFSSRLALSRMGGTMMMSLGLVGTVIGISFSFSGITVDVIGDAQASADAITILVSAMGIAFHTTLLGLSGFIINMVNQHMMIQETNKLFTAIVISD
jgi:hypothetical protein